MAKLNAEWHREHRMPKNATLSERVQWHLEHAAACGCREMPASIAAELNKRGTTPPKSPGTGPAKGRSHRA
ncbi:MAG: hypothetical protein JST22_18310 [Bacteroidetes bacterium]|nr:hypothetical protein [Bacteroidota bacterium]